METECETRKSGFLRKLEFHSNLCVCISLLWLDLNSIDIFMTEEMQLNRYVILAAADLCYCFFNKETAGFLLFTSCNFNSIQFNNNRKCQVCLVQRMCGRYVHKLLTKCDRQMMVANHKTMTFILVFVFYITLHMTQIYYTLCSTLRSKCTIFELVPSEKATGQNCMNKYIYSVRGLTTINANSQSECIKLLTHNMPGVVKCVDRVFLIQSIGGGSSNSSCHGPNVENSQSDA